MIIIHHTNIKNICCGLLLFILLSCMMNNSIDAMPVTMSMTRPTAGKIVNSGTLPGNKKNSNNNNNNNLRPSLPTNSKKKNNNNMVAPPIITPINNHNQNKLEMSSSKNNVPTWWPKHLPSPNHLPSFENLLPTISEKEANDALENNNPMKMDQIVNEWSEKARLATLAGGVSMAMSGAMGVNPAFGMEDMPVVVPAPPAEVTPVETVVQYKEIKTSDTVEKIDFAALNALLEKDVLNTIIFNNEGSEAFSIANDGQRYNTKNLPYDPNFFEQVNKKHIQTTVLPKPPPNPLQSLGSGISGFVFGVVLPTLVLSSLIGFVFNGGQQGPGGPMGGPGAMGKSVAKVQMEPDTNTNFEDVAGCDEAKDELVEVVDFLKNTDKYASLGARIPRGVILEGPPGTGKTLLARAVAGEAGVPFFSVSGSEFVEMFVGVGASRVRDLFKQAKENAPCIVFIDEIDAIGKQRAAGGGMGGNDEREQTLNQILTEMDGFEGDSGVIVMAATNRADVLDNALLRPGRFDRRVTVNVADFAGRVAILKVHARNKPFAPDVDLEGIARRTVGFSGAELQNLLNEAAIYAAREQTAEITYKNIDDALDRLLVGLAKKNRDAQPLTTKKLVALHEAGHAIVGALTPGYDNVAKVTIIPRSNGAGGLTFFAPSEDRVDSGLYNRAYLEAQIAVALGGRVAEELFYDKGGVTTGASSDLQRVAQTARQMVTAWGLSEVIPPVAIATQQGGPTWSKKTMNKIDEEIFALVNDAYATARGILVEHEDLVRELADKLVEKETVNAPELLVMLKKNKKAQEMTKDKYFSYRADAIPIIKTLPSVLEEIETALAAEEEVTEDAAIKVM